MNNNSNNCGDCGTTCSECGRPWAICKQDGGCGCNKCKDIKFCEYGRMANGCIREKQPGCPMQAVIPSVTVESIEGIKNLADCLVHVSDINTTFYIDDKHRPIITWAGPIDISGYDMEGNPNNYRDQIVTDVANQEAVIYDKSGRGYVFGLVENIDLQEQVNNKLDEMAEDGTLADIIGQYFDNPVTYVFPGRWGDMTTSCNANIVKADNKTILFDTADPLHYEYVKQMLLEQEITHFDYVIISHYDTDHCGNFVSLVDEGYIDNTTKLYHGMYSPVFYTSATNYNTIEAKCTEAGITSVCPTDGSTVVDGKISMKFGNTDLQYGENHYTQANDASMAVLFSSPNSSALFMGDALWRAEKYLFNTKFVDKQIDLYCIPHHAIEKTCYLNFIKTVSPKIAFAQTQFEDYQKNKITRNKESAILDELGAKLYYSFNHSANPVFIEQNGNFYSPNTSVDGVVGSELATTTTFYVDASTTGRTQDGTEDYPFKDLPQALGRIGSLKNANVIVNVANGEYGVLNTVDMLKNQAGLFNNVKIRIEGESTAGVILKQGVIAINANVVLSKVTISPNTSSKVGIYTEYSNITLQDCAIANADNVSDATGCNIQRSSDVVFTNVTFNNLTYGIEQYGSKVELNDVSASNLTNFIKLSKTANISISGINALDNVTNVFADNNGIINVKSISQNITQTKALDSIALDADTNLYNKITITGLIYRNNTNYGTIQRSLNYMNGSGITVDGMNVHASDSTPIIYGASATMSISGNTLTITRNGSYTQTSSALNFYAGTNNSMTDGIKIVNIRFERV